MGRRPHRYWEVSALSEAAAVLDADVRGWPEAVADGSIPTVERFVSHDVQFVGTS